MGWIREAEDLAKAYSLTAQYASMTVEGGSGVFLRNAAVQTFEHVHSCDAILSKDRGTLLPLFWVRWVGAKTNSPRPEQAQQYASLEAAIQAVRARYDNEETVWRLGG